MNLNIVAEMDQCAHCVIRNKDGYDEMNTSFEYEYGENCITERRRL